MKYLLGFREADPQLIAEDVDLRESPMGPTSCLEGGPGGSGPKVSAQSPRYASPLGSATLLSLCVLQKVQSS